MRESKEGSRADIGCCEEGLVAVTVVATVGVGRGSAGCAVAAAAVADVAR